MDSKGVISLLMVPSIEIQRSLVRTVTGPFISIGRNQLRDKATSISEDVAEGLIAETLWQNREGTMLLDSSHARPFNDR